MGARCEVALAEELTGGWAQGEQSGQVRSGQNSMWNWDREMRNIVGDKILYREIRMASSSVKFQSTFWYVFFSAFDLAGNLNLQ